MRRLLYTLVLSAVVSSVLSAIAPSTALAAPPGNDLFANAETIAGSSGSVAGDNSEAAGPETGEPLHTGDGAGRSVWYEWTAPDAQKMQFNTEGSNFDTALAVYTASDPGAPAVNDLDLVVSNNDVADGFGFEWSRALFAPVSGTTYYIAVDGVDNGFGGTSGPISLSWATRPDNDLFADAQVISGDSGTTSGTTVGALTQPGEPEGNGTASVWYEWTAPAAGRFHVETPGEDVWLYSGSSVDSLTLLSGQSGSSRAIARVGAGATLRVAVTNWFGGDPFTLDWERLPPIPNDDFHADEVLSGQEGTTTGSNFGATKEAAIQDGCDTSPCPFIAEPTDASSVWFSWTAPTSPVRTSFDTRGSTAFDTRLKVFYQPSNCVGCWNELVQVASNDNISSSDRDSQLAFDPVADREYFIAIHAPTVFSGGDYVLNWRGPPSNDDVADAAVITGPSGQTTAGGSSGSEESGEPNHAGNAGGSSLWFRWTSPADPVPMEFDTFGSNFDTLLEVYTQNSPTPFDFSSAASNNDVGFGTGGKTSRVGFDPAPSTEYLIAVDGFDGAFGEVVLNWTPSPDNDDFDDRIDLGSAVSGSVPGTTVGATAEPAEGSSQAATSIWYEWTAPSNGRFATDVSGSERPTQVALFAGSSVGSLTSQSHLVEAGDVVLIRLTSGFQGGAIQFDWELDPPPTVTIDVGPSGTVTSASAHFEFSTNESGSDFRCFLDNGPVVWCDSGEIDYQNLHDGEHTFRVIGFDGLGNGFQNKTADSEKTRTWTVDSTPDQWQEGLDGSFDGEGMAVTRLGDGNFTGVYDIARQDDGKIVAIADSDQNSGGGFAILRYNTDGSLDSSFSDDGIAYVSFDCVGYHPSDGEIGCTPISEGTHPGGVAIQEDGKIVVVGAALTGQGWACSGGDGFESCYIMDETILGAVARLNADGSPDATFDDDGKNTYYGPGNNPMSFRDVVVEGANIYASGSGAGQYVVAKLSSVGATDGTYGGGDGLATVAVNGSANAMTFDDSGRIVVAGADASGFALARLTPSGTPDGTFSGDGLVPSSVSGSNGEARAVAVQPDGKIVAAGRGDNSFRMVRYNDNGSIDTGFASLGVVTQSTGTSSEGANDLLVMPDGKLLLGGWTKPVNDDATLMRFNADGTLDTTYSGDGIRVTHMGWADDRITTMLLQPDGKVVTGGPNSYNGVTLARYTADGAGPPPPPPPGDSAAPTAVAITPAPARFQTSTNFQVRWDAEDADSGVESFDVRYRTASPSGAFGSFVSWKAEAAGRSAAFKGKPGNTYCFSVRATDAADNTSPYGAERCTTIPLDDRSMSKKGRWAKKGGSGYYLRTFLQSTRKGSTLSKSVGAEGLMVIATKCRGCGKIGIYLGGKLLKKVSLAATRTKKMQQISVATFASPRSGKLVIKVLTSRKPVRIEGVGIAAKVT